MKKTVTPLKVRDKRTKRERESPLFVVTEIEFNINSYSTEGMKLSKNGGREFIASLNKWAERLLGAQGLWPPKKPYSRLVHSAELSRKLLHDEACSPAYFAARVLWHLCLLEKAIEVGDVMRAVHLTALATTDHNNAFIAKLESTFMTGVKVRRNGAAANARKVEGTGALHTEWQRRALHIWATNPRLSNSDVAKRIDRARWNTIRKFIDQPNKKVVQTRRADKS